MEYRSYKAFNEAYFLHDLSKADFREMLHSDDVELCSVMFYVKFLKVFYHHAPLKQKRIESFKQPQWYNEEINKLRKQRDKYRKQKDFNNYRKFRNKVSSMIKVYQNKNTLAIGKDKYTKRLREYIR